MASQRAVYLLVLSAVLSGCLGYAVKEDGPVVQTQFGAVRGMYVEEGVIFLGLPFAAPPVGELRWKPPQRYDTPWAPAVRDGSVPGPACRQEICDRPDYPDPDHECPRDHRQSEDCLYLNIFAPNHVVNSTARLPVLFWLYGGNYGMGTGSAMMYDGRILANKTSTIVVTTNYRLGALGFLVTASGEDDVEGNQGLLDQVEALKWVQENIASFGGDKDRVTLFGQSAGSDSIAIHLVSEQSEKLFQQGIMLSVPFSIPHKVKWEAVRLGNYFAEQLNCSHGDLKCLRSKDADAVLKASNKAGHFIDNPLRYIETFMQWGPSINPDILPGQTVDLITNGKFHKNKPIIIGTTLEENVMYIGMGFHQPIASNLKLTAILAAFVHEKALAVLREYDPQKSDDYRPNLSVIATDWMFTCPTRKIARSVASVGGDVWLYVFDHVWSFEHLWDHHDYCNGHVCHGEDLPFLFQSPKLIGLNMTADEQVLADTMAYHYGNFAHTGDPNKPSPYASSVKPAGLHWPVYSQEDDFTCLNITTPKNVLLEGYREEKCDFFDKLNVYP
ncbi:cAMP-regulated D2 protein-like [Branchiostoma lanceolatum]|uniref:cAMP-regulated D2 protein-like n=1 Tax=Branchiostoma lanceolatum TaxID=7740 RepID=UPI0034520556